MTDIIEVDPMTAKQWVDAGQAQLIDVRENHELASYSITGALHNPMSSFDIDAVPNDGNRKMIFVCAHGMRSAQVGQFLLDKEHLSEAYNLTGGVAGWAGSGLPSG